MQPIVSCCIIHSPKKYALTVVAVVMMLRVWAMYNQSRLILGTLLTLFVMEIVSYILAFAINSDPKNLSGM